jgi:hypothetical protein
MPYVKLDTNILHSTLWVERTQRDVFITALLMAEPHEFMEPQRQLNIDNLLYTEPPFIAEPGWYGFVKSSGHGIANAAGLTKKSGLQALRELGEPDPESRSKDYDGRRMIRIDGGFLILNFMKYRDKDHTAALRQRKLRQRRKAEMDLRMEALREHGEIPPEENVTKSHRDIAEAGSSKKKNGKNLNPGELAEEMELAKRVFKELGTPADYGTYVAAAQAIQGMTEAKGSLDAAYLYILEAAKASKDDGPINRFFFLDQKYLPLKNGGGRKNSKIEQPDPARGNPKFGKQKLRDQVTDEAFAKAKAAKAQGLPLSDFDEAMLKEEEKTEG